MRFNQFFQIKKAGERLSAKRKRIFSFRHWRRKAFILAFFPLAGCGLQIGESSYFSDEWIHNWNLPSDSVCEAVQYKQSFKDFFTKNGEGFEAAQNAQTAVLCLKKKLLAYKRLIRGDNKDYLTQTELKKLLNHEVVKRGMENEIDKITEDKRFHLFIKIKNLILRIRKLTEARAAANAGFQESFLSEVMCAKSVPERALYKKEMDEFAGVLDALKDQPASLQNSSEMLAADLNNFIRSKRLIEFLMKRRSDQDINAAIQDLLRENRVHITEDLFVRHLFEETRDLWPNEEDAAEAVLILTRGESVRRTLEPNDVLRYLSARTAAQRQRDRSLLAASDPEVLSESQSAQALQSEADRAAELQTAQGSGQVVGDSSEAPLQRSGLTEPELNDSALKADKNGSFKINPDEDLYEYLYRRPRAALSIPEVRHEALFFVLTDKNREWGRSDFAKYLSWKKAASEAAQNKKDAVEWYEIQKRRPFENTPEVNGHNKISDSLFKVTSVSARFEDASFVTALDGKYLLISLQIAEMIGKVYDFNRNGLIERAELDSLYCLFESLTGLDESPSSSEKGVIQTWTDEWKREAAHPENVFNYILKYKKIPSADAPDIHFVWRSFGKIKGEDTALSKGDVVELVSVLFLFAFSEKSPGQSEETAPPSP